MLYNKVAGRLAFHVTDPSDDEGGEGGDLRSGGGGAATVSNTEAARVMRNLLARAGVTESEVPDAARKVLRKLAKENYKLREDKRDLKERSAPEGSVVLTGDDAKFYNEVKGLGVGAEDIKTGLAERDQLKTTVAEHAEEKTITTAAESLNFKPAVLMDLKRSRGLIIEMREVEVERDGNKVKEAVPHVKTSAEGAKLEPLKEYAERDLKDYLPALRTEGGNSREVHYPEQSGNGKAPNASEVVGKATAQFVRPSKRNNQ